MGPEWGQVSPMQKKQRLYKIVKSLKTVAVFNGAEGGTRTLTGVTRYPLKIVCLPVPPPRLWSRPSNTFFLTWQVLFWGKYFFWASIFLQVLFGHMPFKSKGA